MAEGHAPGLGAGVGPRLPPVDETVAQLDGAHQRHPWPDGLQSEACLTEGRGRNRRCPCRSVPGLGVGVR